MSRPVDTAPDHATRVYNDVFEMLPDESNPSPLVRVNRLNPVETFDLFAKLEWMNPFGSIKDRAAWSMLRDLEERGELGGERGIVEPTSGNTGISLAALTSARGHHMRAVVPNKVPLEKKILLKICGAELDVVNDELCPSPGMGDGSINLAKTHAKAQRDRYVDAQPVREPAERPGPRFLTTGPEIWRQTDGRITHLFVSLGTCGTVTGSAGSCRERNPDVKVIAVQPTEGHDIPGMQKRQTAGSLRALRPFADRRDPRDRLRARLRPRSSICAARRDCSRAPAAGSSTRAPAGSIERDGEGVGVMIFADNIFKYTSNHGPPSPGAGRGDLAA